MTHVVRVPILLFSVLALVMGQTPVPEPPEQAQKLLKYAVQLDADAKRARVDGRRRGLAGGQGVAPKLRAPVPDSGAERLIQERNSSGNGIYVDGPKVYDDSLLQQMLASAQSRLASLQGFDQSGLARAVGSVTGADQQIASLSISGGVQPPVVQTAYGNVTSPFPPPPATPAAPTTTLPSSPSPSASDILNEQLQVTSEIENLRLLMEGSLSDQIMVGKQETFAKPRVTLGFPVVISPQIRYRNAVAMVEVFVETNHANDASPDGEPPSITALLPREKTYNVAAITDHSASLGLGIATATAGVAAGFLWGHKQYFIVKDQDTLALQFQPTDAELTLLTSLQPQEPIRKSEVRAFAWQFRPVLGHPFVQAGARQVFVQLAFPGRGIAPAVKSFGTVRIRTYWRRVDPRTGVLLWIVPGSLREISPPTPIPNYDMHQKWGAVAAFNAADMEDLGGGKMLIKLDGRLLPGTYLRIGSTIMQRGGLGAPPSDLKTTRFVANVSDLATLQTFVISRDGTEYPLKIQSGGVNQFYVDRQHVTVGPLDDTTSLLRVPIGNFIASTDIPPVLLIGGKVYGYSDAPIDRKCNPSAATCVLSVALPSALLAASPVVSVKALMLDEDGAIEAPLAATRTFTLFPPSAQPEKLVLLSHDQATATYLVYGHDLNGARVIWPKCAVNQSCLQPVSATGDDGTMKLLKLSMDFVKNADSIVLQHSSGNERPEVVPVPPIPSDSAAAPASSAAGALAKFQEPIVVGSDEATLVGTKLDSITGASFGAHPLALVAQTPTSLKIIGLAAAGASAVAKPEDISFVNQGGVKITVPLQVVSSKIEVVPNK